MDSETGQDRPVPTRRGRRPSTATTLADIMAAARSEFAERGFEGARMEQIARLAGVSKQMIYHYFTDKAELYGILLDQAAQESRWLGDRDDYDRLPPAEAMALFVGRVFDTYRDRPAINRMTMDEAIHQTRHVRPRSELAPILRRMIDEAFTPILERGAATGEFRGDVDPDLLFWTLFGIITAWFSQRSLMTLISGARFDGEAGGTLWREHGIAAVLALLRPAPDRSDQKRPLTAPSRPDRSS